MLKLSWVLAFLLLPLAAFSASFEGNWLLEKSAITYQVTHPLHHVAGKSSQARGKGNVVKGKGKFLVGVPVKSFDSGDSNRDTHMLQITQGADHPLILVNIGFKSPSEKGPISADLSIQFAGKTVKYPQVA